MNCKYCNAPLEEDAVTCPVCGASLVQEQPEPVLEPQEAPCAEETVTEEVAEEILEGTAEEAPEETQEVENAEQETETEELPPVQKKKSKGKTVAIVIGCVLIAAIVLGAVLYGLGIDLFTPADDVMYKDNYTVSTTVSDGARTAVVATVGDKTLTNSALQIYYWYSVQNFVSYYSTYLGYLGLDQTQPLENQIYDAETGKTWQQYFLENALESWHRYTVLELLAQEEGYQMSTDLEASMSQLEQQVAQMAQIYGFESTDAMLKQDWGDVCSEAGYLEYLHTNLVSNDYYTNKYQQMQPTAEEVDAFFTEKEADYTKLSITKDSGKYVDVRHILLSPEGGTTDENGTVTYSDAEWEACRAAAQEILDGYLAIGVDQEESFAQLAMEHSQDPGSASSGGLYTDVTVGQMVEPFEQWCFDESRQPGDTGLVQTNYGYHIMYYVQGRDIWYVNAENDLITQRTNELIESAKQTWPLEANFKKIIISDLYQTNAPAETVPATTEAAG